MKRPPKDPRDENGLTPEDRRIWGRVSGSVTPPRSRKAERVVEPGPSIPPDLDAASRSTPRKATPRPPSSVEGRPVPVEARHRIVGRSAPEELEPRRQRRLSRERDPIEARIDLHGFGRFEAEDQLRGFLTSCQARGMRAVLVITGQGRMGGGVIRQAFGEWMQAPALRGVVSGFTAAHRRHGGNGAFYVTLKRRT